MREKIPSDDSSWGTPALGWHIETEKDGLRRVGNINPHSVHHPFLKSGQPKANEDTLYGRRVKWLPDITMDPRTGLPFTRCTPVTIQSSCSLPRTQATDLHWHLPAPTPSGSSCDPRICGTRLPSGIHKPKPPAHPFPTSFCSFGQFPISQEALTTPGN